jgi:hypothetical protein
VPPATLGIGITPREIGLHPLVKHMVIEQFIEPRQFGFQLQFQFGGQLEEFYGIEGYTLIGALL